MTSHILGHFISTYALGIFVVSHMAHYNLQLFHIKSILKHYPKHMPISVNKVNFYYFYTSILERECVQVVEEAERERERILDSTLSVEPDAGQDPRTLGS